MSSNGGVMVLATADQRLGLTAALADCVHDPRDQSQIRHQLPTLLGQRVYQIACGYDDCNEADDLRFDLAFKQQRVGQKKEPRPHFSPVLWGALGDTLSFAGGGEDLAQLMKPATIRR